METRKKILIQFAHAHVGFQQAELTSVLDMHGFHLQSLDKDDVKSCSSGDGKDQTYEVQNIYRVHLPNNDTAENSKLARPFVILSFHQEVPEERITTCLSRCVLIKSVLELWGVGNNIYECAEEVKKLVDSNELACADNGGACVAGLQRKAVNHPVQQHCIEGSKSWKLTIYTFGSKYSREEQSTMRSQFSFLPFTGEVKMDNPDSEFMLIREVEVDVKGGALYPRHGPGRTIIEENDQRPPLAIYFGRAILGGSNTMREGRVLKYSLKKRLYLGPTSMDTELAMIMSNLGQVTQGSFCFDPFVGTGSILVTCALHGAYCFGTDIDIRVLKGRSADENVFSNFNQYNLVRPELVRSDNALFHQHYRTDKPIYDAIICDPPYGIRAGARKTGSKRDNVKPVQEEHRWDHIAQTKPYIVSDVMADLLDVAARSLVTNCRLVFIIPSMLDFDEDVDLPRHPCLKLIHSCYQPLSAQLGRRMVTMKKVKEYDESQRDTYIAHCWVNGPESADKCANIREKLIEAAQLKPGYKEKAEARSRKRKAKKEEKKRTKLIGKEKEEGKAYE